jgi:hypothetical protein
MTWDADDEPGWDEMTTEELASIALGPDFWLNAPALSELGERSPRGRAPSPLRPSAGPTRCSRRRRCAS